MFDVIKLRNVLCKDNLLLYLYDISSDSIFREHFYLPSFYSTAINPKKQMKLCMLLEEGISNSFNTEGQIKQCIQSSGPYLSILKKK